jgi:hypothetical protein
MGVLYMQGADRKVIFQGTSDYGNRCRREMGDEETKESKMVFIGKNLPKTYLFKVWSIV